MATEPSAKLWLYPFLELTDEELQYWPAVKPARNVPLVAQAAVVPRADHWFRANLHNSFNSSLEGKNQSDCPPSTRFNAVVALLPVQTEANPAVFSAPWPIFNPYPVESPPRHPKTPELSCPYSR